jgi:YVTN family beta-propeller protein
MRLAAALLVIVALAGGAAAPVSQPGAPVLERIADVPLPGPAVRFDYLSIDTTSNRLYISHMNAGQLVVFDLNSRSVVDTIGDLPRITGVWPVPTLGKVYASVPGHHYVAVIDAGTLRVEARVGSIGFPDGMAYAPGMRKLYVSDESGGGEIVIDAPTDRVVATIPLGGEAGNTVYDPGSGRMLVAVQSRNEIAEIDPRNDRVIARHPLAGASHPHGLSVDARGRLLFVANEDNATLLVVDLNTMRVTSHVSVGEEPDVLAFDPGWRRLYVASESGEVAVFNARGDSLEAQGRFRMPHAHSVAVDPRTHRVYFPLQEVEGRPLLRIMAAGRPAPLR